MGDLPKKHVSEGLKAHSKGSRVRKRTTWRSEGSKAHSKGGRVRKRTTQEMVAQRHTRKEVRLKNTLPKRWWLKGALERR